MSANGAIFITPTVFGCAVKIYGDNQRTCIFLIYSFHLIKTIYQQPLCLLQDIVIIGVYYCKGAGQGVWQGQGYGTDTCDNLLIRIGNAK